jgi:transposase
MRPKGHAEELERRRRRAVQLLSEGESPTEIAKFLGCTRPSLYRWLVQASSSEGLAAVPHPGRTPKLTDEQMQKLECLLLEGAPAHGWNTHLWTGSRVAKLIQKHFGIAYTDDHARRLVQRRLDWSSQRPQHRAKERNEEAIAEWRQTKFAHIKKHCA